MSQHLNRAVLAALAALVALLAPPAAAFADRSPQPSPSGFRAPDIMKLASQGSSLIEQAKPAPSSVTTRHAEAATETSTPQVRKQVFGYVNAGNLGDSSVGYTTWNFQDLTTVAFFGLHVDSGGNLIHDGEYTTWGSATTHSFITAAHNAGVKVVVSIIQQDYPSGSLCPALQHTLTTAQQTYNETVWKGVDGVNIDYEGPGSGCTTSTQASELDTLAQQLRQLLPAPHLLSIATYGSSAEFSGGFFDIPGLNQSVDTFFVMAYDLDLGNGDMSPVAPLTYYTWNDTRIVQGYVKVVPAGKVILGVPYYGRTACVASLSAARPGSNATPTSSPNWTTPAYLDSVTTNGYTGVSNWAESRDAHDTAGQEPYSTWQSSTYNCWRESYWDDAVSLGHKYDLVNQYGIAGAGIFALDYGGGAAELWNAIATHLTCPVSVSSPASVSSTQWTVSVSPSAGCAASLDLQAYDQTLNQGWFDVAAGASPSQTSYTFNGYAGHTYLFQARAHDVYGRTDAWSVPAASTQVSSTATPAHPFAGLYTLDAYGGVHPADSPPLAIGGYWPGWRIARAAAALPGNPQGGLVLDGFGGLHPYGTAPAAGLTAYWPNWDIARDVAILPDGSGGYVLDGYGGLHPFGLGGHAAPPAATGYAYWGGWDIARKLVLLPGGAGGYVMDGWGGLHPFAVGSNPQPPGATGFAYWKNWDIARGIVLIPNSTMGYTLDGFGGVHPFNGAPQIAQPAYWNGWDIARGIWLTAGSMAAAPAGYVLDGYGGLHPFGGAPTLSSYGYAGADLFRSVFGS
jgi:spore germination protein YaaH